ncbi:inosine 5'-monophosphate dehydrogenase [Symmachiella dynata]|uniref:Inosine 5'-monophosphate dehydrogenase n=1 Tax=Symmachiella dynata TaxID=2527995 RepID=A0A517ZW16_9PLAN|nr:CBS domain-containing protein [Symmachiella dynata]QDU46684.1 inosine 5'-monophosphate dehydrogenase [Symmachiella dynata]
MICPDCQFDNITGADVCEGCGASLIHGEEFTNALERGIIAHSVDVLCAKRPVCVPATTSVREAIDLMLKHQTGAVLVESNGEVGGIFTERDVLNDVSQDVSQMSESLENHMTASPETITKNDSIAYAMHAMDVGGYRHLPIVDSAGVPTGIVSARDIMRFLCVRYANSRDDE